MRQCFGDLAHSPSAPSPAGDVVGFRAAFFRAGSITALTPLKSMRCHLLRLLVGRAADAAHASSARSLSGVGLPAFSPA